MQPNLSKKHHVGRYRKRTSLIEACQQKFWVVKKYTCQRTSIRKWTHPACGTIKQKKHLPRALTLADTMLTGNAHWNFAKSSRQILVFCVTILHLFCMWSGSQRQKKK